MRLFSILLLTLLLSATAILTYCSYHNMIIKSDINNLSLTQCSNCIISEPPNNRLNNTQQNNTLYESLHKTKYNTENNKLSNQQRAQYNNTSVKTINQNNSKAINNQESTHKRNSRSPLEENITNNEILDMINTRKENKSK